MRTCLPTVLIGALCAGALLGCSAPADMPETRDAMPLTGPSFAHAAAGPPRSGGGTGTITALEITSSRMAGSNTIQERRIEGSIDGTLQGTFVEQVSGVIHGNGLVTFHGTLEFTGVMPDCGTDVGTLTARLSGQGIAGLPVTEASFRVVDQAVNSLAVSGTGTLHQVGPGITYEVRFVCR